MKLKKNWIVKLMLLAGVMVVLVFFTPIGSKVKRVGGSWMATGAAKVKEGMQTSLDTYNWELLDLEGNTYQFETNKEQVVLINYWATWCPPCIKEMPSMQKLYDDYGEKVNFMFITDDDRKKVDAFLEKRNLELPVYYSNSEGPKVLSSSLLPTTYIINKEGKIIVAKTGAADWNSAETRELLDGLLAE